MASALGSAPKARAAAFGDTDGEIGSGRDRHRRDRRTVCHCETKSQRRTKDHCSNHQSLLIFVDSPARSPIRKPAGAKLPIEHDKNNDTNYRPAHFHLDERIHLDERPAAAAPVAAHPNIRLLLQIETAQENRSAL